LIGALLVLTVAVGFVLWAGWFRTVDQGETCVVVKLGKISHVAPTGVSWSFRLVNKYVCYSRVAVMYQTAADAKGKADYMDWPITANTSDGQQINVTANVTFHINPDKVEFIYANVGRNMIDVKERVIANYTRSIIRDLTPNYRAEDLYTSGRVAFEKEVGIELSKLFVERGVTLDAFRLRSIEFDQDYVSAIENQQIAQEQVETRQYEAEQAIYEAERNRELAKGDAAAQVERAKGDAESRVIAAKAEAEAIELKGEALKSNPEILMLEFIQQLAKSKYLIVPWDNIEPLVPLDVLPTE
jgi:regulator of protease activity HflC (stomatin/prohibitin superfamily)